MKRHLFTILICTLGLLAVISCGPGKPEPVKVGGIADTEFDPAEFGKVYPLHYESWMKTKDPKPSGTSKYRRGWDSDKITYDRLSEFPFLALLYNGWGFGIEYNEPRGHYYAVIDQIEVDQSRTGAGGVCLACKSPYHKTYVEKHGKTYLKAKFMDAVNMLPEKHRRLGPACADCHQGSTMGVRYNKAHLERGLAALGKTDLSRQETKLLACAQCHVTYFVPRDKDKKVNGDVTLPWKGGSWGGISIETIIADLLSGPDRIEWKHAVTGYNMPFIRHPEFELYSFNSVHFRAGLACADCHMPYQRVGSYKISDHNVTSPFKNDLRACAQCHTESATWLKKQVLETQDRTASMLSRAGYAAATVAKLVEIANREKARGIAIDGAVMTAVENYYKQAFLRLVFIGAENSTGFHNPAESLRVLGDSIAFSGRAEALLRQQLARGGVMVPEKLDLELPKYLNNRGKKPLNLRPEQQLKDPFNLQQFFTQVP